MYAIRSYYEPRQRQAVPETVGVGIAVDQSDGEEYEGGESFHGNGSVGMARGGD